MLKSGGQLEGELLNRDQSPRVDYLILMDNGARIRLTKDQVVSVTIKSPREVQYETLLPRMPDSVEGHWKMAEWCRENGLSKKREHHLNEIVKREPDHEKARYGLGYRKIKKRWIKADEYMRNRGYVRHQGAWRMRQEVELDTNKREFDLAVKQWRHQLRIWRGWIVKGRGKRRDGNDQFSEIKDPLAAPALAEMLKEEEFEAMKELYIDVLARLRAPASVAAFIKLAIEDPSVSIREKCLAELERFGRPQAVVAFAKALKHKDNRIVNRAAIGLGVMKDPSTTVALIDALTTKHKRQIGSGGGLSTTFGQGGGGGLNVGGGPKIIERELRNDAVLTALTTIHPGINYVYNKEAWRNWYASRNRVGEFSFRRAE